MRLANPSFDAVYFDSCKCIRETEQAILVDCEDAGGTRWIPKSQVHDDSEVVHYGGEGVLAVTKWFADKEGLG